ncbi:hypothetical protein [Manganibacter manganicus]|uniref:Uncharacterized protein n=1 Tax=Manganibacter manganicus TaxID=1873176 RepID=A0A1V8RNK0_9HYPH|nr:hypothetical protein [Pseudaminobacter manganicus]OQM74714.1 hypothetical protein BFN67_03495 [Pseudaminobacter manganicus]
MTPAERARLIDKQEFEAECKAVRSRALQYTQQRQQQERERVQAIELTADNIIHHNMPAEQKEKRRNAGRKAKQHTVNGVSRTLQGWADHLGITYQTLHTRLKTRTLAEVVAMPAGRCMNRHTVNGETRTIHEWADYLGITYHALIKRMQTRTLAEAIAMNDGHKMRPGNSGRQPQLHMVNGEAKTLEEWADHIGISYNGLVTRLKTRTLAEAVAMPPDPRCQRTRGVSSNLEGFEGTGAGSTLQEIPDITLQDKPA